MLYLAVFSFAYLTFVSLTSWKLSSFSTEGEDKKRAQRYGMIFGNTIFLGYPLSNALFGQIGMLYASIYIAVQNIFQWTLGVYIYKREKFSLSTLKRLINPGLIAICIGLSMFFLKIKTPALLSRVISGVGAISVPLALIVIGATLDGYKLKEIIRDKGVLFVAVVKAIAFPAVFLTVLYFMPIDNTLKAILTIQAAAPVQASGAVFAKNFGGDSGTIARCVALSTAICAFSIPLFLLFISH
jgi:predicted permease